MGIIEAKLTSKNQITVPKAVREMLNLKSKGKVLWVSFRPGEVSIIPASDAWKSKDWPSNICGKYADDSIDGVQSLLDDRKEDLILEERGYLQ